MIYEFPDPPFEELAAADATPVDSAAYNLDHWREGRPGQVTAKVDLNDLPEDLRDQLVRYAEKRMATYPGGLDVYTLDQAATVTLSWRVDAQPTPALASDAVGVNEQFPGSPVGVGRASVAGALPLLPAPNFVATPNGGRAESGSRTGVLAAAGLTGAALAGEALADGNNSAAPNVGDIGAGSNVDLGPLDADGYPIARIQAHNNTQVVNPVERGGDRGGMWKKVGAAGLLVLSALGLLAADANAHKPDHPVLYGLPGGQNQMTDPVSEPGSGPVKTEITETSESGFTGAPYLWDEAANHFGKDQATTKLNEMIADATAMGLIVEVGPVQDGKFSVPSVTLQDGTVLTSTEAKWEALSIAQQEHWVAQAAAKAKAYWKSVGAVI